MTTPHPWPELAALGRYAAMLAGNHGPGARDLAEHLEQLIDDGVLHPMIRIAIVESRQAAELDRLAAGIARTFTTPDRVSEGLDAADMQSWFAAGVEDGRYPAGSTWAGLLDTAAGMVST